LSLPIRPKNQTFLGGLDRQIASRKMNDHGSVIRVIEDEYPRQQTKATGMESLQQSNWECLVEVTYSWAWGPMSCQGDAHILLAIWIYAFSVSLCRTRDY
jgi:hypothetical protein